MSFVRITTVGNSLGIVLSKELLTKNRVKKGDLLYIMETPNGIELTHYNTGFSKQMDLAEKLCSRTGRS